MAQKVIIGFKNAYYSKITETDGVVAYATPVKLDGAVSMSLSASGDDLEFYADDKKYYGETVNNGYEGTLELSMIPDSFKKDILGYTVNTDGVMIENANAVQSSFALLCEFTANEGAKRYVFYNCMASRPELSGNTKTSSKEVKTQTLNLTIRPNADGDVEYSTTEEVNETVYNNWYSKVYQESTI